MRATSKFPRSREVIAKQFLYTTRGPHRSGHGARRPPCCCARDSAVSRGQCGSTLAVRRAITTYAAMPLLVRKNTQQSMRLKQIKLAGFKSFVDPTTVTFPGNRTAIVGPNGCGKSNIIDAVRWV